MARRSFWDKQADARRRTRRLLLGFALCVLASGLAVHLGLTVAWALLFQGWVGYPRGFVLTNVGMTLFFILGGWWVEHDAMRSGGRKLAQRIGARPARPEREDEQRLLNTVHEMCVAAHMTPPQVVVLARTEAINAFAAGWEPEDSIVAVTQGALDYLSRDELQGLVAHELSHLREGDTRLNMQLAGMVYGLELVYNFGLHLRDEVGGLGSWFGPVVMAAGFVGWLSGRLLKAAVSRQREWLADARALQWTRNPDSIGGVLRKVMTQRREAEQMHGSWQDDQRSHVGLNHPLVQHMLLAEVPHSSKLEHWLDAHPPLEQRVAKIYGRPMRPLPLQD